MKEEKGNIRRPLLLLWGLTALGCLLIFHNYILGNETLVFDDIGNDTRQQYLMLYNSVVNHVRNHNPAFWDFTNGFGAGAFVIQLTHPLLFFVYLAGILAGPEHLAGCMVYYLIAEIFLAGTCCYLYLTGYRTGTLPRVAASFLYAFNGYLIIWGQHYQLGTVVVLFPLLLYFIDAAIADRRKLAGIAAAGGIILLNGYYQGYMCFLGAGIYICLRVLLLEKRGAGEKIRIFLGEAFAMVWGLALGMINLLPSASLIFETTSRLDAGNTSFWGGIRHNLAFWNKDYYQGLIYRLFGNHLQGGPGNFIGDSNYYEEMNLFFGTLFIILLVQYFVLWRRRKGGWQKKAVPLLGAGLILFSMTVKLGSYILNGFAYPFARQSFLFMPFFALLAAHMLGRIAGEDTEEPAYAGLEEGKRRISAAGLAAAAVLICAVYYRAYRIAPDVDCQTNAVVLALTGLGMAAVLYQMGKRPRERTAALWQMLIVLVFLNMVSDARLAFTERVSVKKDDRTYFETTYDSDVTRALEWIRTQDDGFYRVEKNFSTAAGYMESCAQYYYGVSTYNSVQNRNIQEFVEKLWPNLLTGYDKNHYLFSNDLADTGMASFAGVTYLIADTDSLVLDGFESVWQSGGITVYKNRNSKGLGRFYTMSVTEEEYETAGQVDVPALLLDVLITDRKTGLEKQEDILSEYLSEAVDTEAFFDTEAMKAAGMTNENGEISGAGELILPIRKEMRGLPDGTGRRGIRVRFDVTTDRRSRVHAESLQGTEAVRLSGNQGTSFELFLPSDASSIRLWADGADVLLTVRDLTVLAAKEAPEKTAEKNTGAKEKPEEADIRLKRPIRDDHIVGEADVPSDGLLLLTIPYEKGWTISLDGEKQELIRGDYGFSAVKIEKGSHTLEARYRAPGLFLGGLISGIALLLWILFVLFSLAHPASSW